MIREFTQQAVYRELQLNRSQDTQVWLIQVTQHLKAHAVTCLYSRITDSESSVEIFNSGPSKATKPAFVLQ